MNKNEMNVATHAAQERIESPVEIMEGHVVLLPDWM